MTDGKRAGGLGDSRSKTNTVYWICRGFPKATMGNAPINGDSHPDWRRRLINTIQGLRENPVYHGKYHIPSNFFRHLNNKFGFKIDETPIGNIDRGVVGLVVDQTHGEGFINPLRAKFSESGRWEIDDYLPFREIQRIKSAFRLILKAANPAVLAERFQFKIEGELKEDSDGPSMLVAGLMAIIAAVQPPSVPCRFFKKACALVQLSHADERELSPVGFQDQKMEAFRRECGDGSLLIYHPDRPPSDEYLGIFEEKWPVKSLLELSQRLSKAKLLTPFFSEFGRLTKWECDGLKLELAELMDGKNLRFYEAEKLARGIMEIGFLENTNTIQEEAYFLTKSAELYRHMGLFNEAIVATKDLAKKISKFSLEKQASLECDMAAALLDCHQFAEAMALLEPWKTKLETDERLLMPETRRNIWNTLARAMSYLGRSGWSALFEKSLELQAEWEPVGVDRTRQYLARAFGINSQIDLGLKKLEECDQLNPFTVWNRRALRVLSGEKIPSTEIEDWRSCDLPNSIRYLRAFTFLFLARRQGEIAENARHLYQFAGKEFSAPISAFEKPQGLLFFFALVCDLGQAGSMLEEKMWKSTIEKLHSFIGSPDTFPGIHSTYFRCYRELGEKPCMDSAGRLARLVPFL